jgi:MinD superfamily P-loop ATPase
MIIAVASGKGGTGKTTIATSMAVALSEAGAQLSFLDCDVEAPNAHIFLYPVMESRKPVDILIPEVNPSLCSGCGRCAEVCQFNAIVVFGDQPLVFPQLCHGCGSCTLECPNDAISEIPRPIGFLERGNTPDGISFARGMLTIGEPMAVPIISQLKHWQDCSSEEIVIIDSPPGTSCPVVASIRNVDFVILVTEPTPFGLHDLKLAVQLTEELGLPRGVIINRNGIGDDAVEHYCFENNLPILMRIPFEREIGQGVAQGKTLGDINPEYIGQFQELFKKIEEVVVPTGEARG